MISWIVVGMIVVIILVFAKIKHIKHKTFLILILLLILFFYITATKVIGQENVDLSSFGGIMNAGKIYFTWLVHAGGNAKSLAGEAIKMDWVGNVTNPAG